MNRKLLTICGALWLGLAPAVATAQTALAAPTIPIVQTSDRLSQQRMDALVSRPLAIVRLQGLPAGRAAFARRLATARTAHGARSTEVADLLTSFGVALYSLGLESGDRALQEASIPYLDAAIPAYRTAFGNAHPEVAVALNAYADAQSALHEEDPPQSAEAALEEAYRIRLSAFGPTNVETLASLRYLARIKGLPSRIHGNHVRMAAVVDLYRLLIANSPSDPRMGYFTAPYGRAALAGMYARNGMVAEAREQLRLAIEQTQGWDEADQCTFAYETNEVERLLAGNSEPLWETFACR